MERPAGSRRLHRAWFVALVTMGALVAAAGFRSSTGALLEPLEEDFGWSRATTSGAVSLNLIVYGLTAPFAAALMERFGIRRVVVASLALVALGSGLTLLMTAAWQLWLLWGFAVGVGTGALALVFGAIVANRWFVRHRGLVIGVFSAASSTGQLVFLPAIAHLADGPGWRFAAGLVAAFALLLVPLVLWLLRDRQLRHGTTPYGAPADWTPPAALSATQGAARLALATLRESARSRVFWILFLTFWICGWSTNGLIGTHFIPAAHDHGMPATTSASLLALIGVFDIIGTVASGWLTDRVDSRYLLFGYYFFRGLSLLVVHHLLGPQRAPEPVRLHRLLRPGLGGDGAADGGAVPRALRGRAGRRGLRLGVRQPHGRRRRGRELRGLDPAVDGRLHGRLDDRRSAVPAGRRPLPPDPEAAAAEADADLEAPITDSL